MKYHELKTASTKNKKRVGRGISAGQGKTAGRGTKGQRSRTGKKLRGMFMGGQRSLVQAIPKARGFKSLRTPAQVVYLEALEVFGGKTADNFSLYEAGLIKTPHSSVKIILKGALKAKVTVKTQAVSKNAVEAITKAGGSFVPTPVPLKLREKVEKTPKSKPLK